MNVSSINSPLHTINVSQSTLAARKSLEKKSEATPVPSVTVNFSDKDKRIQSDHMDIVQIYTENAGFIAGHNASNVLRSGNYKTPQQIEEESQVNTKYKGR